MKLNKCKGITKSGKPCKNKTSSKYCHLHNKSKNYATVFHNSFCKSEKNCEVKFSKFLKDSHKDLVKSVIGNKDVIVRKLTSRKQKELHKILSGTTLEKLLSILYLMKRHKSYCTPLGSDSYQLFNYNLIENELGKNYDTTQDDYALQNTFNATLFLKNHKNKNYNTYPGYRYGKDTLVLPKNFKYKLKETCLKNKKRFIVIILSIYGRDLDNNTWAHTNALIFDNKLKTLERFEPYGDTPFYDIIIVDSLIQQKLKPFLKFKRYYHPLDFCPTKNVQAQLQKLKKGVDPGGYCTMWCIWYIDMRLIHPNIDREKLIKKAITKIENKTDDFAKFIRSYGIFQNIIYRFIFSVLKDPNSNGQSVQKIIDDAMTYLINLLHD